MTQPPQPPPRRQPNWLLIGAFALLAVFTAFVFWYPSRSGSSSKAEPPPRRQAVTVDQADVAAFWNEWYSLASWYSSTATPMWDGSALVANTKLFPDEDAREPSLSICRAMMMYWVARDRDVQPVRVLDQAGNILVSGQTETSSCAWRR